jgi:hypothetical protein
VYGPPGLDVGDGMCFPHWYGVGDHRVFVVEVIASSLFEGAYSMITLPIQSFKVLVVGL